MKVNIWICNVSRFDLTEEKHVLQGSFKIYRLQNILTQIKLVSFGRTLANEAIKFNTFC